MNARAQSRLSVLFLLAYGVALAYLASFHEMWRDEVRAFSIVQSSDHLGELFSRLKNEGHPSLWYLSLYAASSVWHSPLVMPVLHIVIAIFSASLFIRFAPFRLWLKVLWLLGFYPLYEYSIVCRNYGLGMLFLFLFLSLFRRRFERLPLLGFCLAGLANTSAFAWILSAALGCSLFFECFIGAGGPTLRLKAIFSALFVFIAGQVVALLQMWPDEATVVSGVHSLERQTVVSAFFSAILSQGATFHDGFSLPYATLIPLMMLGLYLLFLRTPSTLLFLFSLVLGMELFNTLIYSGLALRHQGMLVLGIMSAFWMDEYRVPEILRSVSTLSSLEPNRRQLKNLALTLLFSLQIYAAAKAVRADFLHPMSSAKEFSAFLKTRPELRPAIIMSEPDYMAETLPYYLDNRLFFPREGEFKRYVSFTAKSRQTLSLSELLAEARRVADSENAPVILLLPADVSSERRMDFLYGRSFVLDPSGIAALRNQARLLNIFEKAERDENYSMWLLSDGA